MTYTECLFTYYSSRPLVSFCPPKCERSGHARHCYARIGEPALLFTSSIPPREMQVRWRANPQSPLLAVGAQHTEQRNNRIFRAMGTELYHHHHHVETNSSGSMSDVLPSVFGWAVKPPPSRVEQELIDSLDRLTQRLTNKDPTLTHLEPWLGAYADLFLEHASVERAFDRCIQAAHHNTVVESVTLRCLPERELSYALEHLPVRTLHLTVKQSSRSQSLPCSVFAGLTPELRSLKVDTRIAVRSAADVHQLGHALSRATSLQEIELHILPRCSFDDPHLSLDVLLQSLRHLRSVRLIAGYDYNHYHKPLCTKFALAQFLHQNPNLQTLQLDNVGLGDAQLRTILQHVPTTLEHWQTAHHHPATTFPAETLQWLSQLPHLQSCVILTPEEYEQRNDDDPLAVYQDELHKCCIVRKTQRSSHHQELLRAALLDDAVTDRCQTMLLYAWVRADPLATVWSVAQLEKGGGDDDKMDVA